MECSGREEAEDSEKGTESLGTQGHALSPGEREGGWAELLESELRAEVQFLYSH